MEKNIIPFKYVRGHLTYVTYDMFYRIILYDRIYPYSLYDIDCMSDVSIDSTRDFCPSSFFRSGSIANSCLEVLSVFELMSRSSVRVRTQVPK